MKINFVIPSFNRASKEQLLGLDYFEEAVFVVPESQRDGYLKAVGDAKRVVCCLGSSDGNIGRKRNWILENFDTPLVMIDDDVKCMAILNGRVKKEGFYQFEPIEWGVYRLLAERMFVLSSEWGCKLWGCAVNEDNRAYKEFLPFSLTRMVLAPHHAHNAHGLKYDEAMGTKDDYDMAIQQCNRYKKILRVNFLCYLKDRSSRNGGGLVGGRTMESETRDCLRIMEKWGTDIIKYKIPPKTKGDVLNGRVNIPIKGV